MYQSPELGCIGRSCSLRLPGTTRNMKKEKIPRATHHGKDPPPEGIGIACPRSIENRAGVTPRSLVLLDGRVTLWRSFGSYMPGHFSVISVNEPALVITIGNGLISAGITFGHCCGNGVNYCVVSRSIEERHGIAINIGQVACPVSGRQITAISPPFQHVATIHQKRTRNY